MLANDISEITSCIFKIFPECSIIQENVESEFNALISCSTGNVRNKILQHQYFSILNQRGTINISCYIKYDGQVIFFLPLYLQEIASSRYKIFSLNNKLCFPFFHEGLPSNIKSNLSKRFHNFLSNITSLEQISTLEIEIPEKIEERSFSNLLINHFEYKETVFELYYEFHDKKMDVITSRKSYRNLINRGKRDFEIDIIKDSTWNQFKAYPELHAKVAGRVTRPLISWKIMHNWLEKGELFIVSARNAECKLTGYAMFRKELNGYAYVSAAYLRGKPYLGMSHAMVEKSIRYISEAKADFLYLGEWEPDSADQKVASISHFKAGFSNLTRVKSIWRLR